MSDSMAIEELAASYARLKGYIAETRIPCLNREDFEGNKKVDTQGGDIDIIGRSSSNKLLAIETKGYGGVESYNNWCKRDWILEIYNLIDKMLKTKEIRLPRWNKLFKKKDGRFDEIWIIISGPFIPKQNINRIDLRKNWRGMEFINRCIKKFNKLYNDKYEYGEDKYIMLYEKELTKYFKVKCRIIPIHKLIEDLMILVSEDMFVRRKRYPDTALETFRWLIRAIGHGYIDLKKLEKKLKESYDSP